VIFRSYFFQKYGVFFTFLFQTIKTLTLVMLPLLNIPRANVHYIIFVASARAQHHDSLTGWTHCSRPPARPLARQMKLLRKYTLLHPGAATRRYTPEKLLLSLLLSLAGAINIFFRVYPQKYKNCFTLVRCENHICLVLCFTSRYTTLYNGFFYMRHLWTKIETVDFRAQMYGPKTLLTNTVFVTRGRHVGARKGLKTVLN
jgi:hypothetical protein